MDFVDVDSDKWEQYARNARRPMRWLYAREGRELAREEKRIAAAFDAGIFVSSEEAAFFSRQAPELKSKTYGMSNGVDIEFFNPELDYARPYPDSAPVIVFTGMMDYRANVDGVVWFARRVFPLVRAQCPQARFYIVGARPARAIRELAGEPGIYVTGKVADVRPYLAHARLAVAPLQVARGIQNKVLEALAMGKPVIGTRQAFEGIRPSPLLADMIAANPAEFAAAVRRVLVRAELPQCDLRLREFIRERYNWESNLALLDALIEDRAAGDAACQETAPKGDTAARGLA
jgi:sugar transferase (PEP-CTERM/EpsH1 system associated)